MHSFIQKIFIDHPNPFQGAKNRVAKITTEKIPIFKEFTFSVGRRHNKCNK